MKKIMLAVCGAVLCVSAFGSSARAQSGNVAGGPDPSVVKDIESEQSAMHELKVARLYFKNKKAYLAAFRRADELIAGYPEFSKIDEALYIAGMSGFYLSEGKGKQALPKAEADKANDYTPEGMRDNARQYLSRLVNDYPKSDFRKEAEAALAQLGGSKPKDEKKQ
jgi:outer membrane protein assembly factor BamD (BamD/ComL family)